MRDEQNVMRESDCRIVMLSDTRLRRLHTPSVPPPLCGG